MTKEEIKFWKDNQKKLENAYKGQIDALKQTLEEKNRVIARQSSRIHSLEEQVELLQSGLTGEEKEYYKSL